MTTVLDYRKIVDSILAKTGKSEKDIKDMISNKIERFAGLLTEEGAAFMVAKELGLEVEIEFQSERNLKISDLRKGLKNVCLLARVLNIGEIRSFERDGRKGRYCKIVIADETGETTLTLWDRQVQMIDSEKICKGGALFVDGCYVTEFRGNLALSLSLRGRIYNADGRYDLSKLPRVKPSLVRLSDIKEPTKNVDFFARVTRVFDRFEFEKDGDKGDVLRFEVWDGKKITKVVAWHNITSKAQKLYSGELIKIEGADVKEGRNGLEVHLGTRSRIIENPKTEIVIPEIYEITGKSYVRKKINEITEANYFAEVFAEIVSVRKSKFLYDFCNECRASSSNSVCERCGKKTKKRLVVSLRIDDGFANINCIMFGRVAENVTGFSTLKLTELVEKDGTDKALKLLEEKMIGSFVLLHGTSRKSIGQKEEIEMIVDDILPIDNKKEVEGFYYALSEMKP
ncbi:MAG: hypothetical protein N3F05_00750 [Candidatus Diapherotrites archaeon]|nr:hypothetical protein [Candidatus Diapherotrites archaeon]